MLQPHLTCTTNLSKNQSLPKSHVGRTTARLYQKKLATLYEKHTGRAWMTKTERERERNSGRVNKYRTRELKSVISGYFFPGHTLYMRKHKHTHIYWKVEQNKSNCILQQYMMCIVFNVHKTVANKNKGTQSFFSSFLPFYNLSGIKFSIIFNCFNMLNFRKCLVRNRC